MNAPQFVRIDGVPIDVLPEQWDAPNGPQPWRLSIIRRSFRSAWRWGFICGMVTGGLLVSAALHAGRAVGAT